ncbi:hypothetical protein, partial [Amycolatopsis sp. NPDC000740]|uniref:hypothetical protein n=1 Tax=Amycolatopsis sp. NPDC000740 TaxID=3154269 RepID=UPI0033347A1B
QPAAGRRTAVAGVLSSRTALCHRIHLFGIDMTTGEPCQPGVDWRPVSRAPTMPGSIPAHLWSSFGVHKRGGNPAPSAGCGG